MSEDLVITTDGLVPRADLRLVPSIVENVNEIAVAFEWYTMTGKLVRRDAWVNAKAPRAVSGAATGVLNG